MGPFYFSLFSLFLFISFHFFLFIFFSFFFSSPFLFLPHFLFFSFPFPFLFPYIFFKMIYYLLKLFITLFLLSEVSFAMVNQQQSTYEFKKYGETNGFQIGKLDGVDERGTECPFVSPYFLNS